MNCSDSCHQGRQKCPTPYTCGTCGIYSIDSDKPVLVTANSDGSSHDLPVTMEPDFDWLMVTCKTVLLMCAVCLVGIVAGFVWQRLGG